ncbi:hypothetical protein BGW37DRAFT_420047 [Umbelopsis sp. PMI_123]|nr:hypothetical protein BGW37DRAFT_420047 [Umbelopsis sp. PMI_123]
MDRAKTKEGNDTEKNSPRGSTEVLNHFLSDNVTPEYQEGDPGSIVTPFPEATHSLTTSSLATQNDLIPPSPTPVSVWAADLPAVEQPQEVISPSSPRFPHSPSHIFEISPESDFDDENDRRIQETKDVFTDTQKIAYVGLCSVTSLEVVHECQGKDFAYARMSAGNWQRKVIRNLYMHMDITPEEISMIESLAKHNIVPTDLVHQFTSQGETTTKRQLRLSRVFIRKIATYLSLEWTEVIAFERRISEYLAQNDPSWETESEMSFMTTGSDETTMTTATSDFAVSHKNEEVRKSRNKQQKKKRYIMMGLATLGGGLVLGLSAGLMAPVIAGGLGAVLTTVGVTGTSGFLGGTAGIALITSGATVAGGRIGAKRMFNRTKGVDTFEFITVKAEDRVNCFITITGWLSRPDNKEEAAHPFSTVDSLMGDHYTLFWEPELLTELGSAIKIIATEVVTQAIQQALQHTIMGALLAGLTWPLALTKIGYLIDNPWANALDRARIAGLILADSLMNRSMGSRPVTLVGFSLGARVIFFCLLELARMHAFGLVEDVAIFGTPVSASMTQWKECTTVVAGRFINGYATNDWLLGFLFRASTGGLGSVAGLRPLKNVEQNVQNMDCTDLIKGHLHYRTAMPKLLKRAGFEVTSEELPELKEKERSGGVMGLVGFGRSSLAVNESDSKERSSSSGKPKFNKQPLLNRAKASSLSSFSSGKASITLPNRKGSQDITLNTSSISSSPVIHSTSLSSPIPYRDLNSVSTSRDDNENTDMDLIAGIIANAAAAASSKNGSYSSLSSGKASLAPQLTPSASVSTQTCSSANVTEKRAFRDLFGGSRPKNTSATTIPTPAPPKVTKSESSSASFFSKSIFGRRKDELSDPNQLELVEAGIEVKELKSTLGPMVVPHEISNPLPKVTLEMPKHAHRLG